MSQPLIKFVSQNHSDDSVDSHREYKVHRHTCIKGRFPSTEENGFFLLSARFVVEPFPNLTKKRFVRSANNNPQCLDNNDIFSQLHQRKINERPNT